MANNRTPEQKAADAKRIFELLRDEVTPPVLREVMLEMTNAEHQQAVAGIGDVQAYAALVQAALSLQRVVAGNDRAVMISASILAAGGGARVIPVEEELQ